MAKKIQRFESLVAEMRAAQEKYFKGRESEDLAEAKRLEGLVDARLDVIKRAGGASKGQGALTIVRDADSPHVKLVCKIRNQGSFSGFASLDEFSKAITGTALVPCSWIKEVEGA